jgi:hypothetical protein
MAAKEAILRLSLLNMLNALKQVWRGAGRPAQPCEGCDPAILAKCKAAEAGSVTPHAYHVLIKLPAPATADPASTDETWWPERVEDE